MPSMISADRPTGRNGVSSEPQLPKRGDVYSSAPGQSRKEAGADTEAQAKPPSSSVASSKRLDRKASQRSPAPPSADEVSKAASAVSDQRSRNCNVHQA